MDEEKRMKMMEFWPEKGFRDGQEELIEKIYDTIDEGKNILFTAPCGYGKSLCSLTAALMSGKKILVITPNHNTRDELVEVILNINKEKKKELKIIDLVAKRHLCIYVQDSKDYSQEMCKRAKKYELEGCRPYKKVIPKGSRNLSYEAVEFKEDIFRRQKEEPEVNFVERGNKKLTMRGEIRSECEKNGFCPFYLQLDMLRECDVIILDYFWVIGGPFRKLGGLIDTEDFVLLIDEAHEFIERVGERVEFTDRRITNLKRNIEKIDENRLPKKEREECNEQLEKLEARLKEAFANYKEFVEYVDGYGRKKKKQQEIQLQDFIDFFGGTEKVLEIIRKIEKIAEKIMDTEELARVSGRPDKFFSKILDVIRLGEEDKYVLWREDEKRYRRDGTEYTKKQFLFQPVTADEITLENGLTVKDTLGRFSSFVVFSATIEKEYFGEYLGLKYKTDYDWDEAEYGEETSRNLRTTFHFKLSSGTNTTGMPPNNRYVNEPIFVKIINSLQKTKNGVFIGFWSAAAARDYADKYGYSYFKNTVKEGEKVSPRSIQTIGLYEKESGSVNHAGSLKTALCLAYPNHPKHVYWWSNPNIFLRKQYYYLASKKKSVEYAKRFMYLKSVFKTIQFLGRVTRKIEQRPRLLVVCEERYESKKDMFPKYMLANHVVVETLDELFEEARKFWSERNARK